MVPRGRPFCDSGPLWFLLPSVPGTIVARLGDVSCVMRMEGQRLGEKCWCHDFTSMSPVPRHAGSVAAIIHHVSTACWSPSPMQLRPPCTSPIFVYSANMVIISSNTCVALHPTMTRPPKSPPLRAHRFPLRTGNIPKLEKLPAAP